MTGKKAWVVAGPPGSLGEFRRAERVEHDRAGRRAQCVTSEKASRQALRLTAGEQRVATFRGHERRR